MKFTESHLKGKTKIKKSKGVLPGFKIIPHPSDIACKVIGKNFEEALEISATALFSLMTDLSKVKVVERKNLAVAGSDEEELLVNWLNSLIFLFETKHWIPKNFSVKVFKNANGYQIKSKLKGETVDPKRHNFKIEIKAATYNRLSIVKNKNFVRITVVFDV